MFHGGAEVPTRQGRHLAHTPATSGDRTSWLLKIVRPKAPFWWWCYSILGGECRSKQSRWQNSGKCACDDFGRWMAVVWLGFCSPSSPLSFFGGRVERRQPKAGVIVAEVARRERCEGERAAEMKSLRVFYRLPKSYILKIIVEIQNLDKTQSKGFITCNADTTGNGQWNLPKMGPLHRKFWFVYDFIQLKPWATVHRWLVLTNSPMLINSAKVGWRRHWPKLVLTKRCSLTYFVAKFSWSNYYICI